MHRDPNPSHIIMTHHSMIYRYYYLSLLLLLINTSLHNNYIFYILTIEYDKYC